MMLDHNRAKTALARQLSVPYTDIHDVLVWGNHTRPMCAFPHMCFIRLLTAPAIFRWIDYEHVRIRDKPITTEQLSPMKDKEFRLDLVRRYTILTAETSYLTHPTEEAR